MNPSILTTQPSSPHPTVFFHPLRSTTINFHTRSSLTGTRRRKYRYRVSTVRCSSSSSAISEEKPSSTASVSPDIFGGKRELFSSMHSLAEAMSPPVRLACSALIFAGSVVAGYGLGLRFGGSRNYGLGGAVALGVAGAGAVYAFNSCVPEVAAVSLHNYVIGFDDPGAIKKEDIDGIAKKYGVSKQNESFNAELCDIYCRYVSAVIPPGTEDLRGDEVETIIKFKNALGLDDPDAASMHMEIGRRIFRQRLETGGRGGDVEQRRAFQKLIYVSTLVFGEASSFLLPWKRVFKVTDAQIEVAIRDNAQRLYGLKLKSVGEDINVNQLISLREAQLLCKLSDELAEDMFKEHTRKLVEKHVSKALGILKSRTRATVMESREVAEVIEELDKILAFNNMLVSLKNHPDASRFARGFGPITLLGGGYDGDRKMDDLKLLYRTYITDSLSTGRMEEAKLASLNQLANIFGLGKHEAESVLLDVTSKVYRKQLSQAASSGALEAAESKAAFLQNLCEELQLDTEKAVEIHAEIYRQKLKQAVSDGEINDDEAKSLERLQIMLCIPKQTVEAAHADICGTEFEKVVKDAISYGIEGYDTKIRFSVVKAAQRLRVTREVALSIVEKIVRKIFMTHIDRARAANKPTEGAMALKRMLAFNRLVVTRLVSDIKGDPLFPPKEEVDTNVYEEEEWETLETLKNTRNAKNNLSPLSQTEINLKDELPTRDKMDLYKTYLRYCLSQAVLQADDDEFAFLRQLGQLLGLTNKEVVEVHRSMAEQSFRNRVESLLADGKLSKEKVEKLNELEKASGLPSQYAQMIIKATTNAKLGGALETAIAQGKLTLKEIRDLNDAGVNLDTMVSIGLREKLFKKMVESIFTDGSGEFDEEEVYVKIPQYLNIDGEKARGIVQELARSKLSNSLIQAVSLLRQRKHPEVASYVNNIIACDKAAPGTQLSWESPEELADLYLIYLRSDPAPEKLSRVQYLLNISDSTAEALREVKDKVLATGAQEEEFVF